MNNKNWGFFSWLRRILQGERRAKERVAKPRAAPIAPSRARVSGAPDLAVAIDTVKTVRDLSDLPEYDTLLTAQDAPYALSEALQGKLAAISFGKTGAMILSDPESYNRHDFVSLYTRLKKDYHVINVGIAKSSLLLGLYARVVSGARRDRDDKETALSIQLFRAVLAKAAQRGASDVHIIVRDDNRSESAAILYRVDGILRFSDRMPAKNAVEAIGAAYTKLAEESSRSDPAFNRRTMQSCSIPIVLNGRDYKLRYQTIPVNGGIDAIIRLLQTASADGQKTKTLLELGYSPTQCTQLDFAARKTVGAIIVSGVTGSGKSTTLKTLMTVSPNRLSRKSYSIEDPVEYKMYGVSQIAVQRRANDSDASGFTAAMRVVLRADPDIVMVGEVRDSESCSMLKTMVQSGHQVMSTVHASSVVDIVQRLTSKELGLPRETLGSRNFISALIYQRLVPLLCPHCKTPLLEAGADIAPIEKLALIRSKFGLDPSVMYTTNEQGCDHCDHLGSKGVTVVAEIFLPDSMTLRMLRQGLDVEAEEYWRNTRRTAFNHPDSTGKTAFEHGLYKAHLGEVDPLVIENSFEPFETYQIWEPQSLEASSGSTVVLRPLSVCVG